MNISYITIISILLSTSCIALACWNYHDEHNIAAGVLIYIAQVLVFIANVYLFGGIKNENNKSNINLA